MSELPEDWTAFRAWREERLRSPHGYLAVTAIHWLTDAPQRFDDVVGAWSGSRGSATLTLEAGESLVEEGTSLGPGTHQLAPLREEGRRLAFADATVEVAARGEQVIVRPRHPDSPRLRAYRGTPCYPQDPRWRVPARFAAYDGPPPPGAGELAVGELVLQWDGGEHRLVAWREEGDEELWVLFRDATSGVTTYAANRQVLAGPPGPGGEVVVDFNRAFNMPCAYTDLVTCPLPPPGNTLPFAVEAGEQVPDLGGLSGA